MPVDGDLLLPTIVEALRGGRWAIAVSGLITVLVHAVRTFLPRVVSRRRAPWVAASLGVLSGVAAQLAMDQPATLAAWSISVEQGIRTAGGATLIWTLLAKRIARRDSDLVESAEDAAKKKK